MPVPSNSAAERPRAVETLRRLQASDPFWTDVAQLFLHWEQPSARIVRLGSSLEEFAEAAASLAPAEVASVLGGTFSGRFLLEVASAVATGEAAKHLGQLRRQLAPCGWRLPEHSASAESRLVVIDQDSGERFSGRVEVVVLFNPPRGLKGCTWVWGQVQAGGGAEQARRDVAAAVNWLCQRGVDADHCFVSCELRVPGAGGLIQGPSAGLAIAAAVVAASLRTGMREGVVAMAELDPTGGIAEPGSFSAKVDHAVCEGAKRVVTGRGSEVGPQPPAIVTRAANLVEALPLLVDGLGPAILRSHGLLAASCGLYVAGSYLLVALVYAYRQGFSSFLVPIAFSIFAAAVIASMVVTERASLRRLQPWLLLLPPVVAAGVAMMASPLFPADWGIMLTCVWPVALASGIALQRIARWLRRPDTTVARIANTAGRAVVVLGGAWFVAVGVVAFSLPTSWTQEVVAGWRLQNLVFTAYLGVGIVWFLLEGWRFQCRE
jgi:hypothetical protein